MSPSSLLLTQGREEFRRKFLMLAIFYTILLCTPGWLSYAQDGSFHLAKIRGLTATLAAMLPAIILAIPAAFKRWLEVTVTTLVSLLTIIDVWMFVILRTHFSEKILMLTLATNGGEASEFLDLYLFTLPSIGLILGCICVIDIIYSILILLFPQGKPSRLRGINYYSGATRNKKSAFRIFFPLVVIVALISLAVNYIGLYTGILKAQMGFTTIEQIWFVCRNYSEHAPDIRQLEKAHRLYMDVHANSSTSSLDGVGSQQEDSPEQIIWIIGESYNKHHSSLYGYPLPTTPNLSRHLREGNLILFQSAVTPSGATDEVMRIILSPYRQGDDGDWNTQPLVPAIFRSHNWKVSYHDNQTTILNGDEKWDAGNAYFLNSPTISRFNFDYRNSKLFPYDMMLVENELHSIFMPDSVHKALNIFHLMGQHMEAEKRYPADYNHFTPKDYAFRKDLDDAQRIDVANYDNATLYNDAVIEKIISAISPDSDAIIIYHSDHGEEVHDFRRQYGRTLEPRNANIDRNVYEIPFMIYTTPTFRSRHPRLYNQLKEEANRPIAIDTLGRYILGIAGLPASDENPETNPLITPDSK